MDVSGVLFILPIGPGASVGTFPIEIADDIAPGADWHIGSGLLQIIPDNFPGAELAANYSDPGFFLLTCVSYKDPISQKRYVQNSFMRWPGISNGVVAGDLYAAERKEKDALLSLHADFLKLHIEKGFVICATEQAASSVVAPA